MDKNKLDNTNIDNLILKISLAYRLRGISYSKHKSILFLLVLRKYNLIDNLEDQNNIEKILLNRINLNRKLIRHTNYLESIVDINNW